MNFFATNLKYLRRKFDVMQSEIALQVKKRPNTVGNWENGVSEPNINEINILRNFFGISADILLFTELEKGNLIKDEDVRNFKAKGNLNGNPIGNLMDQNSGNIEDGQHRLRAGNEAEELTMWVVLKELRQMSQKIDTMGVSVAEIAQNTAPKKR